MRPSSKMAHRCLISSQTGQGLGEWSDWCALQLCRFSIVYLTGQNHRHNDELARSVVGSYLCVSFD
jgi:hypothetical protein